MYLHAKLEYLSGANHTRTCKMQALLLHTPQLPSLLAVAIWKLKILNSR